MAGKGIGDVFGPIKTGINVGQKISETLFPQTKPLFKDYWSGDIAKGVVNSEDGIFTSNFWTGDTTVFRSHGKKIYFKEGNPIMIVKQNGKQIGYAHVRDFFNGGLGTNKIYKSIAEIKNKYGGALARRKPTLTDKIAEGAAMFVNPTASWPAAFMKLGSQGLKGVTDNIRHYRGGAVDIHKQIGKLPKPKGGWTLPGHKYTGPYNDLENQVRYDPETGEILEIYDQPTGPTDAVAMQHDVDYSVCGDDRKCKNKADRKMVKSLDAIPWKERQWGHTLARTIINTKQKLGLGLNASRR